MNRLVLFLLSFILCTVLSSTKKTVHIIPHTHDDLGWIMTVDEYFDRRVKNILDNMMVSLKANEKRTFIYVEIGFFRMWYPNQTTETKNTLKEYLKEGRFEFIMGGYTMHDESSSHFQHSIDQIRIGLQFLWSEFKFRPKIAWFIDPFGHSASNAIVLKEMGFEEIVFVRIDDKEKRQRRANKTLEFLWTPFKDLSTYTASDRLTTIFTHITYNHYCPFPGMDDMIQDKEFEWTEKQIEDLSNRFVEEAKKNNSGYLHDNVIFFHGCDFTFQAANANYDDMEKIMNKVNSDPNGEFELVYSTPTRYFNAVFEEMKQKKLLFPTYENNDFFPYADNNYSYWSGYFTSRSNLKVKVREVGNTLESASHLVADAILNANQSKKSITNFKTYLSEIFTLREKLGICQHHDAVAGTAKDYVSLDYEAMLTKVRNDVTNNVIGDLLSADKSKVSACIQGYSNNDCEEIFSNYDSEGFAPIDIYNNRIEYDIYILKMHLIDSNVKLLNSDKVDVPKYDIICQPTYEQAPKFPCVLYAEINLTKKGSQRYYLQKTNISMNLEFKRISSIKAFHLNSVDIEIGHSVYEGYDGQSCETKGPGLNNDGAYIFTTKNLHPTDKEVQETVKFENGKVVKAQISIKYSDSYLHIRTFQSKSYLEIESVYNPYHRGLGINQVLHIRSDIKNSIQLVDGRLEPAFWTDSNGLKMMRRVKDFRRDWEYNVTEPVAANFYPTNFAISIRDETEKTYHSFDYKNLSTNDRVLNVFNDRPQSSGTMNQGEIMILLTRSSTKDDDRGVDESLYESSSASQYFKLTHYITEDFKSENEIYDYIHFKPIFFNNRSTNMLSQALLPRLIDNKGCLQNVQVLSDKSFFVQIFNRNDPYFAGENTICEVTFNSIEGLKLTVKEVQKHGAFNNSEGKELEEIKELKFLEFNFENYERLLQNEESLIDATIQFESQEFKLFLVELN